LVSFYEGKRRLTLNDVVEGLNKSVFTVGKNLHQSTGFFIRLDKRKGQIEYINASHVSMYRIPAAKGSSLSVKQVQFAEDPISSRLGETLSFSPKVGTLDISSGDVFILVTDGIFDLSFEADSLSEKKFLRLLIDLIKRNSDLSINVLVEQAKMMFLSSNNSELKDDVTLVALKFLG
jgi:serine phosphatase RsbU (regulator of sigma subunit)